MWLQYSEVSEFVDARTKELWRKTAKKEPKEAGFRRATSGLRSVRKRTLQNLRDLRVLRGE
jgi:hypothetical protein